MSRSVLGQGQSLSQKLRFSPVMVRSLSLLNHPLIDLRDEILKEIKDNPALEIESEPSLDSIEKLDFEKYHGPLDKNQSGAGKQEAIENLLESPQTLSDYLVWQLHMEQRLSDVDLEIGERIIENLDDKGFFIDEPFSLCEDIRGSTSERVEQVLAIIRRLDPAGCAVWNENESIMVQAELLDIDAESKKNILTYCQLLLSADVDDPEDLKRIDQCTKDEKMKKILNAINPYPGYVYRRKGSNVTHNYIYPDILLSVRGDTIQVEVNSTILPVLVVDKEFKNFAEKNKALPEKEVTDHMIQRAERFIESIRYRENSLEKIAEYIARTYADFLLSKVETIQPLFQKDVAKDLHLHESTISRIVSHKHVQTPRGLLSLRYFFSQREDVIQARSKQLAKSILEIIKEHSSKKHLSDRIIASKLEERGLKIARRTVAKYRKMVEHG